MNNQLKLNKIKPSQINTSNKIQQYKSNKSEPNSFLNQNSPNQESFRPYTATIYNRTSELNSIFYQNMHPNKIVARSVVTLGQEGNYYVNCDSLYHKKSNSSRKFSDCNDQHKKLLLFNKKSLQKIKSTCSSPSSKTALVHRRIKDVVRQLRCLSPEEIVLKNNERQRFLNINAFPMRKYNSIRLFKQKDPTVEQYIGKNYEGRLRELYIKKIMNQERIQPKNSKSCKKTKNQSGKKDYLKSQLLVNALISKKITIQHY